MPETNATCQRLFFSVKHIKVFFRNTGTGNKRVVGKSNLNFIADNRHGYEFLGDFRVKTNFHYYE